MALLLVSCSDSASTASAAVQDSGVGKPASDASSVAAGIVLSRAVSNGKAQVPSAGVSEDTGNGTDITFGDNAGIASPRLVVKFTKSTNTLTVVLTSLNSFRDAENYGLDPVVLPGNQAARLCLLGDATSSFPACKALGVNFAAASGTVSFTDTLMLAYPSGTAKLTMNGTGSFTPF